ncbi:MAG: phosphomannomutase/phosphoglucomutase [Candidatus Kerfeldbacteria bacterium]|nr:phosphomannomutase/phosphoglucomutase [Candidatus Kerfeldbacteria bacterium]
MSTESIFKAYDIRGIYQEELTEDVALRSARAFATRIQKEEGREDLTFVVGQDMRLSSPALQAAVVEGLTKQGVNVVDIGLVSTPAFYFGVAKFGYDGGIMITASHNPGEYNGLKMVRRGAAPVSRESGIMEMKEMVCTGTAFTDATTGGTVTKRNDIVAAHVAEGIQFAHAGTIRPLKVVADCANSMGATYIRELFHHLPCTLIEMNFELDGSFPAHEADPFKEENNRDLMKRIVAEDADLGIATDGDGDRIFFFDNTGAMIEPAIVRGLLAQIFLREFPAATICYDIRPGRVTRDMIEEAGGRAVVTRVGHSLIKDVAIREGAVFAGESSGHLFVKMPHGMFEAPEIVTLKLLEYFSASAKSVAEQVAPYRRYVHSGEINSRVEDPAAMMNKIMEAYSPAAESTSTLDGMSIEYPKFWFNVRPSNTEPLLRLNLEAVDANTCKAKTEEILNMIRS